MDMLQRESARQTDLKRQREQRLRQAAEVMGNIGKAAELTGMLTEALRFAASQGENSDLEKNLAALTEMVTDLRDPEDALVDPYAMDMDYLDEDEIADFLENKADKMKTLLVQMKEKYGY